MRFFYVYKHEGAGTAHYGLEIIFSSKVIHCWQKFREFLKNPITSSQKRQSFWLNLCNPKALIVVLRKEIVKLADEVLRFRKMLSEKMLADQSVSFKDPVCLEKLPDGFEDTSSIRN